MRPVLAFMVLSAAGLLKGRAAETHFTDWIVGPDGSVSAGTGDRFFVSRHFTNGSRQSETWNTAQSELIFDGYAAHTVALAGHDAGAIHAGFTHNFAWHTVRLRAGHTLTLTDGNADPGAALYTGALVLEGGLPQLASLTGNGGIIYYDPLLPANAYLLGKTWPLTGGGSVTPIGTAPLAILSTSILPAGALRLVCRGVPAHSHTVKASSDLITFTAIGTVIAAADGTFTFEDPAAAILPRRFYRVEYP
jgi:hypothetical protein